MRGDWRGAVVTALLVAVGACDTPSQLAGPRQVTDGSASSRAPAWSPDGRLIAFESNRFGDWNLYVTGAEEGGLTRLTESESSDRQPSWSPDGTQLVFVSDRTGTPELHLFEVATREVRLLAELEGNESFPAWSPDGEWIAFSRELGGELDILRVRPGERVPEGLLVGEGRDV